VEELAGIERNAHEALRLLLDPAMLDADGGLQRRLRHQPGVAPPGGQAASSHARPRRWLAASWNGERAGLQRA